MTVHVWGGKRHDLPVDGLLVSPGLLRGDKDRVRTHGVQGCPPTRLGKR